MINKNELPKNWEVKKLGEVCEILDGKRKPINSMERNTRIEGKLKNNLFPYYGATGQVGLIDDFLLNGEYVLLGEDGAPFLEPFKPKAYLVKGKIWVNNHAHILKSYFSNKFLCYYLNQISYREFVSGTTRLKLNQSSMKDIPCVIPPLIEQQRIVAKIEELFSELDAGVESLKTAQAQLKTYRQAVLKWAFEGKLTNDNLPDGELPANWKWVKLAALSEKISDGPFGSNLKSSDYVTEGVRVIRLENIGILQFKDEYQTFVTEEKYSTIAKHTVTKGDIIFSSFVSDEIRVTILPDYINKAINKADCFCVRTSEDIINRRFLAFFLATKNLYNQLINEVHGATRPRINTTQLKSCLIPYCSLEEQQRIVQEIESRLSVCDKLEETINASLQQAEALRQSILKKAFEGKLLAPNDGQETPATVTSSTLAEEEEMPQPRHQLNLFG